MEQVTLQDQLAYAIALAATKHKTQRDKGGNPYILHCLKVMHYIKEDDIRLKIAAVLHDIVEDTSVTLEDLVDAGINSYSVEIIKRMTKVKGQSSGEYLQAITQHRGACVVKLADLRHNTDVRRMKGLSDKDLLRMKKYHTMHVAITEALSLYDEINKLNKGSIMKKSTHKGKIQKPSMGWEWVEELRETRAHWISAIPGIRYRKKDGKRVGGEDYLVLDSVVPIK